MSDLARVGFLLFRQRPEDGSAGWRCNNGSRTLTSCSVCHGGVMGIHWEVKADRHTNSFLGYRGFQCLASAFKQVQNEADVGANKQNQKRLVLQHDWQQESEGQRRLYFHVRTTKKESSWQFRGPGGTELFPTYNLLSIKTAWWRVKHTSNHAHTL